MRNGKIKAEHIQVLKTLYDDGKLSRQAMKSIRGQIISMKTDEEREMYLRKLIKKERSVFQCEINNTKRVKI